MEGVPLSSSTAMAAGQQLSASQSSSAASIVPRLLQVGVPHSHRNGKHLDPFARLRRFHRCRLLFPDTAVHRDPGAREDRVWCVLLGRHCLSGFFVRFPYAVLSLGNCGQTIFQVIISLLYE